MKELHGKAAEAAQSWNNKPVVEAVAARKAALAAASAATNVEQWAVKKAVHYNEWANFGKKDFEPIVAAFRDLLGCFRCEPCDSWIYLTPRVNPKSVRCDCNGISLNRKLKPK
jgi:hypothetical protein